MARASTDEIEGLDPGIKEPLQLLLDHGVETFESCQGGDGHCFAVPTIRFHGSKAEGFRVLGIALQHGLKVTDLRRYWAIEDGEPAGPHWEIVLKDNQQGSP